jgi:hypothetical protein
MLAVVLIFGIAVMVWLLATIFGGGQNMQSPPRRRPDMLDFPPQQRPPQRVVRSPEELRRVPPPVRRPIAPRPEPKRPPVVLEEVKEEPAPVRSLEALRDTFKPIPSPSRATHDKTFPTAPEPSAPPPKPAAPQEAPRDIYTPPLSPSQVTSPAAKPVGLPTMLQVRQMLRSPQSAAVAFVVREILDAPRCRRRL